MSFIDSTGQTIEAHSLGVQPIKSLSAVSALGAGTALDGVVSRANAVATKDHHQFGRFGRQRGSGGQLGWHQLLHPRGASSTQSVRTWVSVRVPGFAVGRAG
jgi:hypothetical protein